MGAALPRRREDGDRAYGARAEAQPARSTALCRAERARGSSLLAGQYDAAACSADRACRSNRTTQLRFGWQPPVMLSLDRSPRRDPTWPACFRIDPGLRASKLKGIVPFRGSVDAARYVDGLRQAGLAESDRVNAMPDRRLEFWFEYGSTYTYLTVARLASVADGRKIMVDWRPFLLMPILIEQGLEKGPFLPYPNKLRYMWRDLERRARRHSIPYQKPSLYPPNTLLTARIGYLAQSQHWCTDFTREDLSPSLDRGCDHRNR